MFIFLRQKIKINKSDKNFSLELNVLSVWRVLSVICSQTYFLKEFPDIGHLWTKIGVKKRTKTVITQIFKEQYPSSYYGMYQIDVRKDML